ncbi:hypothetical protein C8F04DRAFT_1192930 [Mycena alexandri]|uniref:Uncharacterized protein n=1 Tax=Mycena alexandri TaxID=1745969 RepID=A0AAD6SD30_9AGAR|nr:hypothetical protein C8F04DRAFT_1192930 [Mycena alexandri]
MLASGWRSSSRTALGLDRKVLVNHWLSTVHALSPVNPISRRVRRSEQGDAGSGRRAQRTRDSEGVRDNWRSTQPLMGFTSRGFGGERRRWRRIEVRQNPTPSGAHVAEWFGVVEEWPGALRNING